MKSKNDYGYLRDFIDLVPDPLVIINKKTFKIYFVNQEFQHFLKKSFSLIQNTHLNELFNNDLFFLTCFSLFKFFWIALFFAIYIS